MYNDIVWRAKGNEEMCIANFKIVANYAKRFAHGLDQRRMVTYKPNGEWYHIAEDIDQLH